MESNSQHHTAMRHKAMKLVLVTQTLLVVTLEEHAYSTLVESAMRDAVQHNNIWEKNHKLTPVCFYRQKLPLYYEN